jgi:hypothetical protein
MDNGLAAVLGAFAGGAATFGFGLLKDARKRREDDRKERHDRSYDEIVNFWEPLQFALQTSHDVFVQQSRIRNRLADLLVQRGAVTHEKLRTEGYAGALARLRPLMNEEEAALHGYVRGFTYGTIYEANKAERDLLKKYPRFSTDVPRLAMLREHLDVWVDAADFQKSNPNSCLVYLQTTGLGEGFPVGIESLVAEELEKARTALNQ